MSGSGVGRVAVFDLDRTLVAGASAPVFAVMLRSLGVAVPSMPGERLYFEAFERFGEDPVSAQIGRSLVQLFAGQSVRTVTVAGRLAADVLASHVLPGAAEQIAGHRSDGTALVLATSAPSELAEPLAEQLDFDHTVCSRLRRHDGVFVGAYEGRFVWGREKARAVRRWAAEHDVDLQRSTAYADSWADRGLLESVGTPVAVNPDVALAAVARSKGWDRRRWTAAAPLRSAS